MYVRDLVKSRQQGSECLFVRQVLASWSGSPPTSTTSSRESIPSSETRCSGEAATVDAMIEHRSGAPLRGEATVHLLTPPLLALPGTCTIRAAWRPPATSLSLCQPPSYRNCPPSSRRTSSLLTVSGMTPPKRVNMLTC